MTMAIPGYDRLDFTREVVGSTAYINERLTTADKPVKMIFWTGDALPDAATIKLAYDAGLENVNGGTTILTRAHPSLTGLSPLIRPTAGGIQYYAPIINENLYTNLWQGPYYGFRGVLETFALTDAPRRLRGLHLYYHFYSATKQASIRVMQDIYRSMQAEQPISLWMSQYIRRMHGLHQTSRPGSPMAAGRFVAWMGSAPCAWIRRSVGRTCAARRASPGCANCRRVAMCI